MQPTEEHVRMAAKLYEFRDAAKRLLRDQYAGRMAVMRGPIEAVAQKKGCTPVLAAAEIARGTNADGYETIFLMAAAVEMIEPSTAART